MVYKKNGETAFFDQRPKVYGADKLPIVELPEIGSGSVVKVSGEINCWYAGSKYGMTLWLQAIQIIDLVERTGQRESAEDYGFGEEDGDCVAQDSFPDEASDEPVNTGATGNF